MMFLRTDIGCNASRASVSAAAYLRSQAHRPVDALLPRVYADPGPGP